MDDLVYRLRKRAEIRRQIPNRKSVQHGEPDRIADLLEEAADYIDKKLPDENPPPWVQEYKPKRERSEQREWVGLTDEDIYKILNTKTSDAMKIARTIEAKLKEKNGG